MENGSSIGHWNDVGNEQSNRFFNFQNVSSNSIK